MGVSFASRSASVALPGDRSRARGERAARGLRVMGWGLWPLRGLSILRDMQPQSQASFSRGRKSQVRSRFMYLYVFPLLEKWRGISGTGAKGSVIDLA